MGVFGVTASSQVGKPFIDTATAKCPRLRYGMREQAAVFSCECLGEWLIRETFKKAVGCSFFFYVFGCKITLNIVHSDTFLQNILWTHDTFLCLRVFMRF